MDILDRPDDTVTLVHYKLNVPREVEMAENRDVQQEEDRKTKHD